MAAQLTSTNGAPARGPARCTVRATRPFPVPVSPRRRIGGRRGPVAARLRRCSICSRNRPRPALSPTISSRTFTGSHLIPLSATSPRRGSGDRETSTPRIRSSAPPCYFSLPVALSLGAPRGRFERRRATDDQDQVGPSSNGSGGDRALEFLSPTLL